MHASAYIDKYPSSPLTLPRHDCRAPEFECAAIPLCCSNFFSINPKSQIPKNRRLETYRYACFGHWKETHHRNKPMLTRLCSFACIRRADRFSDSSDGFGLLDSSEIYLPEQYCEIKPQHCITKAEYSSGT